MTNRTIKGTLDIAAADGVLDECAHMDLLSELAALETDALAQRSLHATPSGQFKERLREAGLYGWADHVAALEADANRYQIMRMVACEQDEAKRAAMNAAMDEIVAPDTEVLTPADYDALSDQWLAAIVAARDKA